MRSTGSSVGLLCCLSWMSELFIMCMNISNSIGWIVKLVS